MYIDLCRKIKQMCPNVTINFSLENPVELLVFSSNYSGDDFDKITETVMEFEKKINKNIDFYYVERDSIKEFPKKVIVF